MTGRAAPSRRFLTSILFTDIVGSTDLAAEIGDDSWRKLVAAHHEAMRAQLRRFGGKEIDTAGDGMFASFEQPAQAVRAADAMVDQAASLGLPLRAGVHTGEAEQIGPKVGGIAVHLASRVMSTAEGGQVLVSSTVHDLVAGSGLEFADAGVHALKGIPGEWHLFSVVRPDAVPLAPVDKAALAAFVDAPQRRRRLVLIGAASLIVLIALVTLGVYVVLGRGSSGPTIPPGPDTVVALDSSGKAVDVRHVPVGPMALASDNQNLWVAALDAGVIQAIPLGGSSTGQTIGRVGRPTGIAIGGGPIWAADALDQVLTLIDPTSGATNRTIQTPAAAIEFGANAAWDVDDIDDSIYRLDAQSGDTVATIALAPGAYPNAISVTADAVWVANGGTSTVTRIDPSDNSVVVAAIPLRFVPDSISAGDQVVWVGSRASDSLLRLDPSSNAVSTTINVCDQPRAVAADGTGVWVACVGPGEVWHLDHDGKQLSTTPVNGEPTDLLVDNGRVWVTVRQP
jgi:class 3 adenylate cyclase/DNA-binding beta-propeller fold protein YncE